MKYAVWFVRLIYAAWMIPAGLVDRFGGLRLVGAELQPAAVPGLLAELPRDVRERRQAAAELAGQSCTDRARTGGPAMTRVLDGLRLLLGAVMVITAIRYFL